MSSTVMLRSVVAPETMIRMPMCYTEEEGMTVMDITVPTVEYDEDED
jgi:hypothetical protein